MRPSGAQRARACVSPLSPAWARWSVDGAAASWCTSAPRRWGLGWQGSLLSQLQLRQRSSSTWMQVLDTEANRRQLAAINHLDAQLHRFAAQLVALDGTLFAAAAQLMQLQQRLVEEAAAVLERAAAAGARGGRRSGASASSGSPSGGARYRRYSRGALAACGLAGVSGLAR